MTATATATATATDVATSPLRDHDKPEMRPEDLISSMVKQLPAPGSRDMSELYDQQKQQAAQILNLEYEPPNYRKFLVI